MTTLIKLQNETGYLLLINSNTDMIIIMQKLSRQHRFAITVQMTLTFVRRQQRYHQSLSGVLQSRKLVDKVPCSFSIY
jgi:hypothetical protein